MELHSRNAIKTELRNEAKQWNIIIAYNVANQHTRISQSIHISFLSFNEFIFGVNE